jgi:hypothetical protein
MTNYAIATQYIIDLFDSNDYVNTILFGAIDAMNLNKNDVYPLVHIMPSQISLEGNRIHLGYDIAVVDIRTTPNHFQTQKIFGDNLVDSLNMASRILIETLTKLELKSNQFDIILESSAGIQPIIFEGVHLLDGFEGSIIISIQNEIGTC